ncbi:EAP30/Vps36 family-domain-containing protein [Morchella snyderi]|nr:EAP30/Vps36 family-domain-containing protein [Morchella snyderi]
MRKGVGLGALTRTTHTRSTYTTHGAALQKSQIDHLTTQLSVFQSQLSAFARTHAAAIRSTPAFRHEFARMCAAIGVDPLITSRGRRGGGGGGGGGSFWAELLGADVGDFYFELAVRVVEVCRRTRAENGGLISVVEVVERLSGGGGGGGGGGEGDGGGGGGGVGEEDVLRAVEALRPLGSGFAVVQVGRRMMVRSVPRELNRDQATVLGTIEICGFGVAASMVRVNLGWEPARVTTVLEDLVTEGLVWVDEQAEEREYWVPGVMGKK